MHREREKNKWDDREKGNVEQEQRGLRERERAAGCSVHLFLNESRDSRERGWRGGTREREREREKIELMSQQM